MCISWTNKGFDNIKMHGATVKIIRRHCHFSFVDTEQEQLKLRCKETMNNNLTFILLLSLLKFEREVLTIPISTDKTSIDLFL
jgi:hypothetical protein